MNIANALRNVANAFKNNFSALENVANGLKYVVMRCQCIFQRIFDLSLMPGFRKEGHKYEANEVVTDDISSLKPWPNRPASRRKWMQVELA